MVTSVGARSGSVSAMRVKNSLRLRVREMPAAPLSVLGVAHQGFYFAGVDGDVAREQFAAVGRDQRIVFGANADVPERLGNVVGGPHVNAGFDGQNHAGAKGTPRSFAVVAGFA